MVEHCQRPSPSGSDAYPHRDLTGLPLLFQLGDVQSPVKWLSDSQWKGLLSLELAFPDEFSEFPTAIVASQIQVAIGNETIVRLGTIPTADTSRHQLCQL